MTGQSMMLVLYGPTATGKTSLALKLAKKFNGELISADSRQVYKKLDIGTGKISSDINANVIKSNGYWIVDGIRINGFDLKSPGEKYSVAEFVNFAEKKINGIIKRGKLPIVVGGTGFYTSALLQKPETINIKPDWELRRKLEKLSAEKLFEKLIKVNPKRAGFMNDSDKKNPRRLIRAIETSNTELNETYNKFPGKVLISGLTGPNEILFKRADKHLEFRIKNGMFGEVENLINENVRPKWLINLGLEYKWATKSITGKLKKAEAVGNLKRDIHRYIKRQKTFFRQFPGIFLYDISKSGDVEKLFQKVEDFKKTNSKIAPSGAADIYSNR